MRVSTRTAEPVRHRCVICLHAPLNALCFRRVETTVGVICLETGAYWRYDISAKEQSPFRGSSKYVTCEDDLSVNVLELMTMVVTVWVFVIFNFSRTTVRDGRLCVVAWGRRSLRTLGYSGVAGGANHVLVS